MRHRSIGHCISAIYRHLQIHINQEFSAFGFGSGQYLYFNHIAHHEGITQKELSALIAIDKATTAKAVHKLIKQGYVCSEQDPEDRRSYKLYLTESGRKIMPEVRRIMFQTREILNEGLSDAEMESALKALHKMFSNITAHNEKGRGSNE